MAGFNVDIVIGGVKDELTQATQSADQLYERDLTQWKKRKAYIEMARDKVRRILVKTQDAGLSVQEKAELLVEIGGRYDSTSAIAAADIPAMPQRVQSARERGLGHVIATLESSDDKTVTVADLRGLGVLQFVQYAASAR